MVTNDSSSDSLYKAMSADAFRDLVDGKVTNDKSSEADDLVLSAKALKEYVEDKLISYAKNEDSVWFDAGAAVGSDYQGVYVEGYGKILPSNVVYRGNVTNASDCLVVVPFVDSSNIWHYDYIKRSDLYNRFIDQLYFTFTINQSSNQTITVTTSNGVRHTSSFSVKYGTTWTASIAANSGYKPGTLSATSGTVRGNTSISATAAVPSKPPYTEKSWTTPGTYTWTCPAGVTRIRVAVCGGGGGGSAGMLNGGDYTAKLRVENGSASSFDDIVYATGGGGSYVDPSNDDEEPYCEIYSAGYPNGHSGNKIIMVNTMNGGNHRAVGGQGFAISFIGDSGNWGKGGDAYGSFYKYNHIDWLISGSSGGYNSGYINVQENKVYAVKVGSGGFGRFKKCATISSGWSVVGENGNSGFVLIAYGGDI